MEAGFLVTAHTKLIAVSALFVGSLLLSCSTAPAVEEGSKRQQIRFYKANKIGQTERIRFTGRKGKRNSCQNFIKKTRIFRVNQFGFAHCQLFSKKNCSAEAAIPAKRTKDESPETELTQGYSWFPIGENERGVKLRSWLCTDPD